MEHSAAAISDPAHRIIDNVTSKTPWPSKSTQDSEFPSDSKNRNRNDSQYLLHSKASRPLSILKRSLNKNDIRCEVLLKHLYIGETGSSKDEIGYRIIEEAEECSRINPDTILISYSSGNLSIAIARAAIRKKYKTISILPFNTSQGKLDLLRVFGSKIILTPCPSSSEYNGCHYSTQLIALAQRVHSQIPNSCLFRPYEDSPVVQEFYENLAEEILWQCGGKLNILVGGTETTGMLNEISKKLKTRIDPCKIFAVKTVKFPTTHQKDSTSNSKPLYYESEVQDLGCPYNDFHPPLLERDAIDDWITVEDKVAFCTCREIIELDGVLVGLSAGALVAGTIDALKKHNIHHKTEVKVLILLQEAVQQSPTNFLARNFMAQQNFLTNEEFSRKKWWWSVFIGNLHIKTPTIISHDLVVRDVVDVISNDNDGAAAAVVIDTNKTGKILGVVTKDLRVILESIEGNVEAVLERQLCDIPGSYSTDFKMVDHACKTLGDISLLLEENIFLLVTRASEINSKKGGNNNSKEIRENVVGLIVAFDLLNYISKVEGHHRKKSNWDVKTNTKIAK